MIRGFLKIYMAFVAEKQYNGLNQTKQTNYTSFDLFIFSLLYTLSKTYYIEYWWDT